MWGNAWMMCNCVPTWSDVSTAWTKVREPTRRVMTSPETFSNDAFTQGGLSRVKNPLATWDWGKWVNALYLLIYFPHLLTTNKTKKIHKIPEQSIWHSAKYLTLPGYRYLGNVNIGIILFAAMMSRKSNFNVVMVG